MIIIDVLLLIILICILTFLRCKPWIWTVILTLALIAATALTPAYREALIPIWAIFAVIALFANVAFLRQRLITRLLIQGFRKVLPPMSQTEREALEAGQVWWEGELFCGRPDWKKLHDYPKPTLTAEEHAFLNNEVEHLCHQLNDWDIIQQADLSAEAWKYLKENRFFGMIIPKEYGGLGFSALMQSTVVMKLGTRSLSAAVTTMVPNSLGPAELLLHYGTDEQKNYYLPRLARAEEVPCFALTSTQGGSDAGAMPDTGIVCKGMHEGKEVLGIRLNFSKRYITLAPIATVVGLAFKLFDPEHLLGTKKNIGITCVLIPATHPGIEIGRRHYPLYASFMNGPVAGKDVFIPIDWIIGGPEMAGQGWRMLMECLSVGRGISLPALSAAVGKVTYRATGAYAKLREQFKVSIGEFEGIKQALAKLSGFTYMLEATRLLTAGAIDLGEKPSLASAIAKYHMTEMARTVSDIAMDIHAGRGIQTGPRNYLANIYLNIPVAITVEGANILTRNLMIFGQGAVRCHPYVFAEMQALSNPDEKLGLKQFDRLFASHIGYGLSNLIRAISFGLTGGAWIKAPVTGPTSSYYKKLTRMSTGLALISDLSMLMLGGDLKRKESLSARMGDILSYLYLASATLKYYQDHAKTKEALAHVDWTLQYCLYQIQEAFYGVFENFTKPGWGALLKWIIFPFGRCYALPKDNLGYQLAKIALKTSDFRDQLTESIYIGDTIDKPLQRLEIALQKLQEVEPLLKRVHDAMRNKQIPKNGTLEERLTALSESDILTAEELASLREFETLRLDALEVDDFDPDFFNRKSS